MESSVNSAIQKGYFQQVRFLIEFGLSVNERDEEGRTPLINCAFIEQEKWGAGLARTLIEHNASIGLRDKKLLNAMHYACMYERPKLVKIYLHAIDFDINKGDKQGNTPLHYAVSLGNEEITRYIIATLKKYQLSVDKPNNKGMTPLILAWKSRQLHCARLLIELGEANQEARDHIEFKTARQWEHEAYELIEEENQIQMENARNGMDRRPLYQRSPKRRVKSASLLNRRKGSYSSTSGRIRPSTAIHSKVADKTDEERDDIAICKELHRLVRSASARDLRNNPEYIFQVNPIECFVHDNRINYPQSHRFEVKWKDAPKCDGYGLGWKMYVKKLMGNFDFQFTQSYRKSAQPPDPSVLVYRPGSPQSSESPIDTKANNSTPCRSRKNSIMQPAPESLARRRLSTVTPQSAMATVSKARRSSKAFGFAPELKIPSDGSSTESLNRKKSKEHLSSDNGSDVSTKTDKSDKKGSLTSPRSVKRGSAYDINVVNLSGTDTPRPESKQKNSSESSGSSADGRQHINRQQDERLRVIQE